MLHASRISVTKSTLVFALACRYSFQQVWHKSSRNDEINETDFLHSSDVLHNFKLSDALHYCSCFYFHKDKQLEYTDKKYKCMKL
jgi:hypothetical protein